MKASVIVCVYEREREIVRCLESVVASLEDETEIVVVDDGSRDGTVEAVRSLVATGAGVAVLPDLVYRPWSLEGDRIEARPTVEPLPPVRVGQGQ